MSARHYIKFLRADGTAPYSNAPWSLPTATSPGDWMPAVPVNVCYSGYHATTLETAVEWIDARAYLLEYDGEPLDAGDKVVGSRARLVSQLPWDDRLARSFAADCAERVLPIYERAYPGDERPRLAVRAARDFANGRITVAAWDAAEAAARAAVLAAGDAWAAALAAAWAAARAAGDAAEAAALAATRAAAPAAERRWQAWQLGRYLFDGYEGES